jgi:hypothetical protein
MTVREEIVVGARLRDRMSRGLKVLRQNFQGFNNVMGQNMEQFKRNIVPMQQNANRGAILASRFREATHGMRGFRMEMLGVMFFGMALQRFFTGLLRPALEVFSVFELISTTLRIVFLPIVAEIFPFLLGMMEFFMNLPDPVKEVIGVLTILGAVFGMLLFLIGTFTLGLGALTMAGSTISAILGTTATVFGVLLGVMLIVKGVIDVVKGKWEGLGIAIAGLGGVLAIFIGWWALIPIAIGAAVFLVIRHWETIKSFFFNLWEGIKSIFWNAWNWINNTVLQPMVNAMNFILKPLITSLRTVGGFLGVGTPGIASPGPTVGGGVGGSVVINQTINATTSNKDEMDRLIKDNNSRLVEEFKRTSTS